MRADITFQGFNKPLVISLQDLDKICQYIELAEIPRSLLSAAPGCWRSRRPADKLVSHLPLPSHHSPHRVLTCVNVRLSSGHGTRTTGSDSNDKMRMMMKNEGKKD